MSHQRKLNADIDRALKKIEEYLQDFDNTFELVFIVNFCCDHFFQTFLKILLLGFWVIGTRFFKYFSEGKT